MFEISMGTMSPMLWIALSALPIALLAGWFWHQALQAGEDEILPDERLLAAIGGRDSAGPV